MPIKKTTDSNKWRDKENKNIRLLSKIFIKENKKTKKALEGEEDKVHMFYLKKKDTY